MKCYVPRGVDLKHPFLAWPDATRMMGRPEVVAGATSSATGRPVVDGTVGDRGGSVPKRSEEGKHAKPNTNLGLVGELEVNCLPLEAVLGFWIRE